MQSLLRLVPLLILLLAPLRLAAQPTSHATAPPAAGSSAAVSGGAAGSAAEVPPAHSAPAAEAGGRPEESSLSGREAAQQLLGLLRNPQTRAALEHSLEAQANGHQGEAAGTNAEAAPAHVAQPAEAKPATEEGEKPAASTTTAPAAAATPAAPTPATPAAALLAPGTVGAQLIDTVSTHLNEAMQGIGHATQAVTDLPSIGRWLKSLAYDPIAQRRLADAGWKLPLLFLLAGAVYWAIRTALRRSRQALTVAPAHPLAWWRRVLLALLAVLVDVVALTAFVFTVYGAINFFDPLPSTRVVGLMAAHAISFVGLAMALVRALFAPLAPHRRLVPVHQHTAEYIVVWSRRLLITFIGGWALADTGRNFGLPWSAYDALLRIDLLLLTLFAVIIVLQKRRPVAAWLRAPALKEGDEASATRLLMRGLRNRLASIWHLLVIIYIIGMWLVWALRIQDGFPRLAQVTLQALAVLLVVRVVHVLLERGVGRLFGTGGVVDQRYPVLRERAAYYAPALRVLLTIVMLLCAVLLIFWWWGFHVSTWFASGALGGRLLGSLISLAVSLIIAVVVWEAVNGGLRRHVDRLTASGQAARGARIRTLLPMLRTGLAVLVLLFVVLNTLTALGVNVAPLLAGAGVVGLAVGFGSQKLVQDFITGIFLLFEDAMAVGDSVSVAGKAGVVEHLSIRSIKLRDSDGAIHIIPFSSVTTVSNSSRDFAFAMVAVDVSPDTDTDAAAALLRQIVKDMREEAPYSDGIRDDLELWGVDAVSGQGATIKGRIKTAVGSRWSVQREFLRRVKKGFAEEKLFLQVPVSRTVAEPVTLGILPADEPSTPEEHGNGALPGSADTPDGGDGGDGKGS